jgi:hypothetical protein
MKKSVKILYLISAVLVLAGIIGVVGLAYAAEGDGPGQGVWTVRERYTYTNITASDNTIIKASPGMIAGLVVNGGTMGAITIYDNTTCGTGTIATISSPFAGQVIPFGANTLRGLCIRTAAAMNITVLWK